MLLAVTILIASLARARAGKAGGILSLRHTAIPRILTHCHARGLPGHGCADPCTPPSGSTDISIGSETYVCLIVNSLNYNSSSTYQRIVATPKADEFSRIVVGGSWQGQTAGADDLISSYGNDIAFHVESMGMVSFQKRYRDVGASHTFPLYTAIINVDRGTVTGVTFDNGCHFCSSSSCEENMWNFDGSASTTVTGKDCFWDDEDCVNSNGDVNELCQLTVYLVWRATQRSPVAPALLFCSAG